MKSLPLWQGRYCAPGSFAFALDYPATTLDLKRLTTFSIYTFLQEDTGERTVMVMIQTILAT